MRAPLVLAPEPADDGPDRTASLALCLLIFTLYASDVLIFIGRGLGGGVAVTGLYSLTYLVLLGLCLPRARQIMRGLAAAPEILLIYAIAMASVLWSIDRSAAIGGMPALLLSSLLGFYLGATLSLRNLILFVAIGFVLVAATQVIGLALVPSTRGDPLSAWPDTWRGLHNQKNNFGETVSFGVIACLYAAAILEGRARRVFLLVAIVFVFLLYKSESRSSQIATLFIVAVGALGLRARDRIPSWLAGFALFVVVTVGLIYALFATGVAEMFFVAIDRKPTMSGRIPVWGVTWSNFIVERPILGYGEGFWDPTAPRMLLYMFHPEIRHSPYYAHNGYVETMLTLGLVGVAALALMIARLVRNIAIVAMARPRTIDLVGVAVFTAHFLLANFTEGRILSRNLLWQVMIAFSIRMAILAAASRASRDAPPLAIRWPHPDEPKRV